MSHKDGRVVLSAWVEPVLRDYAREAAKAAGVQFSLWVEGAVQRAVAEQSAAKALRIYPVHASHLTDVVTLLEDERDEALATVERLRAALRGLFKPDQVPYAQWTREMHAAHIALERSATLAEVQP